MFLKSIKFCRFEGQKNEWSMEGKLLNGVGGQPVTFQEINLVVGKNATGKSKTINAIRQLSDLLSGDIKLSELVYDTSIYDLLFDDNGSEIAYYLEFEAAKVKQEVLQINGIEKLKRSGREGNMFYEKANTFLEFQMEDDKLAVSRVDNIQQPFFEPLQNWGKTLKHFRFGGKMGKEKVATNENEFNIPIAFIKSDEIPLIILLSEIKKDNSDLIDKVKEDMSKIGYKIESIGVETIYYKNIPRGIGVSVKEKDIDDSITQIDISQGMFRALSLLIQLNFSLLSKIPSCILIDDIGEGLDYERSKSLIDLIIEKVKGSTVQVIMTTNDRFVMNNIPLEYWSVIHRVPKKSLFYNYQNSKEIFDEFKYTGLSNFDFLSTEFYFEGFEQPAEQV